MQILISSHHVHIHYNVSWNYIQKFQWISVLYLTNRQKSKFTGWFKIAGEIKELVFPVNM